MKYEKLQSTGEIARDAGIIIPMVDYAIKAISIKPAKQIGHRGIRLYSPQQVKRIMRKIHNIREKQQQFEEKRKALFEKTRNVKQ